MARSTKDGWLSGDGDLKEEEVTDVPVPGQSVKIRALSATISNGATSEAVSTSEVKGEQRMKVDSVKLDIIRFAHGVIEPQFTVAEATLISGKYGPAFSRVITAINRLSGITEEAVADTEARFPDSGTVAAVAAGPSGASADGAGGSAQPARAGGRAGNDGK